MTCVATKTTLTELNKELPPFLIAQLIVLLLLTFVPALSVWLPHYVGF